jgi:hypothetical protein
MAALVFSNALIKPKKSIELEKVTNNFKKIGERVTIFFKWGLDSNLDDRQSTDHFYIG